MGYSREVYDAALAALEKRRIDAVNRAAALKDRMAAKYPRVREIEAMMAGCSVQVAKAMLHLGDDSAPRPTALPQHTGRRARKRRGRQARRRAAV